MGGAAASGWFFGKKGFVAAVAMFFCLNPSRLLFFLVCFCLFVVFVFVFVGSWLCSVFATGFCLCFFNRCFFQHKLSCFAIDMLLCALCIHSLGIFVS